MSRLSTLMAAILLTALLITGCGGGSSRSEQEVAQLVRGHGAYAAKCVKSSGDAYDCTALTERTNVPVKLGVTVSQSGNALFVTSCEVTKKSVRGEPCSGVH
jgi:hypothetical protein